MLPSPLFIWLASTALASTALASTALASPGLLQTSHAAAPTQTLDRLVSANGRGAIVFDGSASSGAVLSDFRDHLYQQASADTAPGLDLLYDASFGLANAAEPEAGGRWLTASSGATYQVGTGIMEIDRSTADLRLTETVFAPQGLDLPAYVQLLHIENISSTTQTPRLFSLHNHHLGDDRDGVAVGDEDIWVDGSVLAEAGAKTGLGMAVVALGSPDAYTCDSLWTRMPADGALDGRCGTADSPWTHDDQVGGWQWNAGSLAPGEDAWVGVVVGFFDDHDASRAVDPITAWIDARSPAALLAQEEADWTLFQASLTVPGDASAETTADELAVYGQALAFLKMAQVTEAGDAFGQIPASLPVSASGGTGDDSFTHIWNITWVRDSAYAIAALSAAGRTEQARDALAFLLQDKAGDYAHLVGRDYGLSVCRLYGDGSEWSDDDGTGPNVELDNLGLLLWALQAYVDATGDVAFVQERADLIFGGIADVLVDTVGDDGLVMADSSIWERHWDGHQQHFAYTQAWAVRGLRDAARLAAAVGDEEAAMGYSTAAADIATAVCTELVDDQGVLAASSEQVTAGSAYLDIAGVDALNNGTLDAGGRVGQASLDAWQDGLSVSDGVGLSRNDDGDLYDLQEWIWADLRVAQARRRACDDAGAQALEDRVTAQAVANHWTLPELLTADTASFAGPAPMMGFGSGLYVLNLLGRADAEADCADGIGLVCEEAPQDSGVGDSGVGDSGVGDSGVGDSGVNDSGTSDPTVTEPGCGCGASGNGAAPRTLPMLLSAVLMLMLGLRRRPEAA